MHEVRFMTAVELHLNATYDQLPVLKSVYEKSQSEKGGKLFSSYRTVFEPTEGQRDFKVNDLKCSYEELVQKEVSSSVLGSFIQLYYHDNGT